MMFSLEKTDPRSKFVILLCLSTCALTTENVFFLMGLLLFTVIFMIAGGVSPADQWNQGKMAMGMILFLFLLQVIFSPDLEGIMRGIYLSLRLLIVVLSALIMLTGHPRDYLLAMSQCHIPYEIAFMTMTAFHFFPVLRQEALDVYYSVQLRGTELKKGSVRKRMNVYLQISMPILMGALDKAKVLAGAMEARCFRIYPYRTYMRRLCMKKSDRLIIVVIILLSALFITCADADTAYAADDHPEEIILSWTGDTAHTQAVSWSGFSGKEGLVEYREKYCEPCIKTADKTVIKKGLYYRYKAVMKGLVPGSTYIYRVKTGDSWSEYHTFRTAGETDGEFSFLYLGDVQYELRDEDYPAWGKMLEEIENRHQAVSFALTGGDLVESSGDIEDWQTALSQGSKLFSDISMMTAVGNHETSIRPYIYLKMMALPENGPKEFGKEFYYFDYGDCRFTVLNTAFLMNERKSDMGGVLWRKSLDNIDKWIKETTSNDKKWNFVVMHHPAYGIEEDDSIYGLIRKEWVPIFEKNKTDIVFCGHQHVYMRTKKINKVTYIMGNSGRKRSMYYNKGAVPEYVEKLYQSSANYQVITVKGDSLGIKSYDAKGRMLDAYNEGKGYFKLVLAVTSGAALIVAVAIIWRKKRKKI